MDMQLLIIVLAAVAVSILVVRRFSHNRYGSLRPNLKTTQAYLAFVVQPGMSYYLSGPDTCPNAIIGIDRSWTLESALWQPLEIDSDSLKRLVENMKSAGLITGAPPYGYDIHDDRGGKIGDCFSLPGQNMTVWMRGENRVALSPPGNPSEHP